MGATIVGAFAVHKIVGFISGAVTATEEWGGSLVKLQRLLGTNAAETSQLAYFAKRYGVEATTMAMGIKTIAKDVAGGGEKLAEYGIAALDASGKSRPFMELLGDIAEKSKELGPGLENDAMLTALLGRSGMALAGGLSEGKEGLAKMTAEVKEYGLEMDQSGIDKSKKMVAATRQYEAALLSVKLMIGEQFIPILTDLMNRVSGWINQHREAIPIAINITIAALQLLYNAGLFLVAGFMTSFSGLSVAFYTIINGLMAGMDSVAGAMQAVGLMTDENAQAITDAHNKTAQTLDKNKEVFRFWAEQSGASISGVTGAFDAMGDAAERNAARVAIAARATELAQESGLTYGQARQLATQENQVGIDQTRIGSETASIMQHQPGLTYEQAYQMAVEWNNTCNRAVTGARAGQQAGSIIMNNMDNGMAGGTPGVVSRATGAGRQIAGGLGAGVQQGAPQPTGAYRGLLGVLANAHIPFISNFSAGAAALLDSFAGGMTSKQEWLGGIVQGILSFVRGFFGGSLPEWGPLAGGESMFLGGQALIQKFGEGLHFGSAFVQDILRSITARIGATMSGGFGVAQWIPTILQAMAITGTPIAYMGDILAQMMTESGGNPNAINLTDSNAAAGDPSGGLMQNIGSAMAGRLAGTGLPVDMFNPLSSLVASMRYVQSTYGGNWGIVGAPNHSTGYLSGGISTFPQLASVSERGDPEIHLTKKNVREFLGDQGGVHHHHYHLPNVTNARELNIAIGERVHGMQTPIAGAAF